MAISNDDSPVHSSATLVIPRISAQASRENQPRASSDGPPIVEHRPQPAGPVHSVANDRSRQPWRTPRLSDARINFQTTERLPETGPCKIVGVEFAGVTVSSLDLTGTMLRMQLHCSPAMWARWSRWLGGANRPDIHKGSQFLAIMFVLHYNNNKDEWAMADTAADWDEAVGELMKTLDAAQPIAVAN